MSVAQDGCIFIQGGLSVELTDDGVEVWISQRLPGQTTETTTTCASLTPDDMDELAQELVRWAKVLRERKRP